MHWLGTFVRRAALTIIAILAAGLAVAMIAAIVVSPNRGQTLMEVLKIATSWPLVVGVLGSIAFFSWRDQIGMLIGRINAAKFPGGELSFHQPQPPTPVPAADKSEESGKQIEAAKAEVKQLHEALAGSQQERQQLFDRAVALLDVQIRESIYWRFSYLMLFFVPKSKIVFRWICTLNGPFTLAYFHDSVRPLVPDQAEREIILGAFHWHGLLISHDGINFAVSDLGRQFLDFLNTHEPLPTPPPQPAPTPTPNPAGPFGPYAPPQTR